jgi:hypothetical protein
MRAAIMLALSLGACTTVEAQRLPQIPRDPIATVQPSIDCQWKAAARYDDGTHTIQQIADHMLAVCVAERIKARRAFHFPSYSPEIDLDEYRQALEIIENVRKSKLPR